MSKKINKNLSKGKLTKYKIIYFNIKFKKITIYYKLKNIMIEIQKS